jgi:hypothetical protein
MVDQLRCPPAGDVEQRHGQELFPAVAKKRRPHRSRQERKIAGIEDHHRNDCGQTGAGKTLLQFHFGDVGLMVMVAPSDVLR